MIWRIYDNSMVRIVIIVGALVHYNIIINLILYQCTPSVRKKNTTYHHQLGTSVKMSATEILSTVEKEILEIIC